MGVSQRTCRALARDAGKANYRDSGKLAFFIEVGKIEKEHRARACPYLLAANVLWIGTAGATLGMSPDGRVMLCYHEPIASMTLELMVKIMDGVINAAQYWEENLVALQRGDLEELQETAGGSDEPGDPPKNRYGVPGRWSALAFEGRYGYIRDTRGDEI